MKTVYKKIKTNRPSTIKKIPVGSGSLSRSKIIIIPAGTIINSSDLNNNFNNTNNNLIIREVPNRNSICTNSDSGSESDSNNSVELNKSTVSVSSNKSNYRVSSKTHQRRSLLAVSNLTKEEKLQRRKLKNRLAAQHCRDKRRIKIEEMEMEIRILKEKNRNLESINDELKNENDILTSKNEILRSFGLKTQTSEIIQENTESMIFQSQTTKIMKNEWPLSPKNNEDFVQENVDFLESLTDEDMSYEGDVSIFDAKWPWEEDLKELFIPDL